MSSRLFGSLGSALRRPLQRTISSLRSLEGGLVELEYAAGQTQRVTATQLRDLCMSPDRWNSATNQRRTLDVPITNSSLSATNVKIEDLTMKVWWSDGLETTHHRGRLQRLLRGLQALPPRQTWAAAELTKEAISVNFDALGTTEGVQRFASILRSRGIVVARGVPRAREGSDAVIDLLGAKTRAVMYGLDWDVRVKVGDGDMNDSAYSGDELPLHTDGSYLPVQPEIQCLLCMEPDQHGGGFSEFADGFEAAERLRRNNPEAFEILRRRPLVHHFEDETYVTMAERTIVGVSDDGQLQRITWNNLDRTLLPHDPEHVAALRAWQETVTDPALLLKFRLEAGEKVIWENTRVLHGRSGQFPSDSHRFLIGNYCSSEGIVGQILHPRPMSEEVKARAIAAAA